MKIAIDMDGVLAVWNTPFAALLETLHGRAVEQGPEWPLVWNWPKAAGFTNDEIAAAWRFINENPLWWAYLPLTDDAAASIPALHRLMDEHDVIFITNRHASAKTATEAWIIQHFGIYGTVLTFKGDKGPLFDLLDVELALDDKPSNLLSAKGPVRLILIDAPYNHSEDDPRLERMTLADILDELMPRQNTSEALYE